METAIRTEKGFSWKHREKLIKVARKVGIGASARKKGIGCWMSCGRGSVLGVLKCGWGVRYHQTPAAVFPFWVVTLSGGA